MRERQLHGARRLRWRTQHLQAPSRGHLCRRSTLHSRTCVSTLHSRPPSYAHVGLTLTFVLVMLGVIGGLYFVHRRNRTEEREKRAQYWREQEQFRQNIMQMREQARTSLLSLPWQSQPASPRNYSGANLEEYNNNKDFNSITPMLHAAAQPSGLRNEFSDNGSEDNGGTEETLVMRPGPRAVTGNGSSTSTSRRGGAPTKRI